jgi:hypothetical protein
MYTTITGLAETQSVLDGIMLSIWCQSSVMSRHSKAVVLGLLCVALHHGVDLRLQRLPISNISEGTAACAG